MEDVGRTALASSCASLFSRILCHPIDTLKARMQAESSVDKFGRSSFQVLGRLVRREGIGGMYRGFGAVAVVGTPAGMIYLTTYEVTKGDSTSPLWHFVCGLIAEAAACVLFVPVDVVKERLQVAESSKGGAWKCAVDTFKEGALYKGYGATLFSFGIYSGLYFAFYERAKKYFEQSSSFATDLVSAFCAASAASWLTAPLDLAKLRLQVAEHDTEPFFGVLRRAAATEGLAGLFRGAGARVAFFAPSTAIGMATFEQLKRYFLPAEPSSSSSS